MIAVIGATGHIGNCLARILAEGREEVVCIVPEREDLTPLGDLKVSIRYADITNYESIKNALSGCRKVFHLAGIVSISKKDFEKVYKVNVVGTRNVIRACIENNVERLVYTSSVHALMEPVKGIVIDEKAPLFPSYGNYAKTKAIATREVLKATRSGLNAVIVCPTGVIGPYDFKMSEMGTLLRDFGKKKIVPYINGYYDFVDVRDVARGHVLAMEKGKTGEIYILSGEKISVREILDTANREFPSRRTLVRIPIFAAKMAAFLAPLASILTREKPLFTEYSIYVLQSNCDISCEKAKKELGYSARNIRESIRDSIIWFRENGLI